MRYKIANKPNPADPAKRHGFCGKPAPLSWSADLERYA